MENKIKHFVDVMQDRCRKLVERQNTLQSKIEFCLVYRKEKFFCIIDRNSPFIFPQ